ncbi:hypothetical protein C1701_23660 [Actinoalloteichus sp. AHMU CJ021]|nr:hypothetical protein C1701_23660 [Actinoalloteichus sp. AHMU CJ021]
MIRSSRRTRLTRTNQAAVSRNRSAAACSGAVTNAAPSSVTTGPAHSGWSAGRITSGSSTSFTVRLSGPPRGPLNASTPWRPRHTSSSTAALGRRPSISWRLSLLVGVPSPVGMAPG